METRKLLVEGHIFSNKKKAARKISRARAWHYNSTTSHGRRMSAEERETENTWPSSRGFQRPSANQVYAYPHPTQDRVLSGLEYASWDQSEQKRWWRSRERELRHQPAGWRGRSVEGRAPCLTASGWRQPRNLMGLDCCTCTASTRKKQVYAQRYKPCSEATVHLPSEKKEGAKKSRRDPVISAATFSGPGRALSIEEDEWASWA
ncbi:hypothetical protein SAY87_026794 [Trapa incisa]|uniref:Uncharacterized protein n=1 Tax=Trapa incisa TaxID=236973 RepID=A0AAN7GMD9_9MYRT|nr:hypothetical protein SAY87_026794 [Trapa incisa]